MSKFSFVASRLLLFCICLTLLACSSTPVPPNIIGVKGVDSVGMSKTSALVYAKSGICKFRIRHIHPDGGLVSLYYEKDKPFKGIEGVRFFDKVQRQHWDKEQLINQDWLEIRGKNQLFVKLKRPLNWEIQVIDFYR